MSRTSFGRDASAYTLLPQDHQPWNALYFTSIVTGLCNGYPRAKAPSMYGGLLLMAAAMIVVSFFQDCKH